MLELHDWLRFFHIFAAIIAVGFNATYGIVLARAAKEPEHEGFGLRLVKVLDDRFANPAYAVLLGTGLWMVFIEDWDLTEFWLLTSIILFGITGAIAGIGYTPTLRKQIEALEAEGPSSANYRRLANRGRTIGILLAVLVVGILFLMVLKPDP